jgi:PIN domain nuclease of toxin-antitoxin system
MKYLLDTHILLWQVEDSNALNYSIKKEFEDYSNHFYVSYISLFEIFIKNREGKLKLSIAFDDLINNLSKEYGVKILPFTLKHVVEHRNLVPHPDHNDPFDHIIISQSIADSFTLISADRKFPFYRSQGLRLLEND